jgi:hypothetical protein
MYYYYTILIPLHDAQDVDGRCKWLAHPVPPVENFRERVPVGEVELSGDHRCVLCMWVWHQAVFAAHTCQLVRSSSAAIIGACCACGFGIGRCSQCSETDDVGEPERSSPSGKLLGIGCMRGTVCSD